MRVLQDGEAVLQRNPSTDVQRAPSLMLRMRRVVIDRKVFVCFSAHSLLEVLSEADRARPGHPCD